MGQYLYSDVLNDISDRLNNQYFVQSHSNEMLRAVKHALRDINIGKIYDDPQQQDKRPVGYSFQRATYALTYTAGTLGYSLAAVPGLKFVNDVILASSNTIGFTPSESGSIRRRYARLGRTPDWGIEYSTGVPQIVISYSGSTNLTVEYFSKYLVVNQDGTTLQETVTGENNETFLIPDQYIDALVDIAAGYLYTQDRNERTISSNIFLDSGRSTLKLMIDAEGQRAKRPVKGFKIRSEWGAYERSHDNI